MGPFDEELASFAMPKQLLGVEDCGWPVETCSESLFDQCSRGGADAAGSSMYVI